MVNGAGVLPISHRDDDDGHLVSVCGACRPPDVGRLIADRYRVLCSTDHPQRDVRLTGVLDPQSVVDRTRTTLTMSLMC